MKNKACFIIFLILILLCVSAAAESEWTIYSNASAYEDAPAVPVFTQIEKSEDQIILHYTGDYPDTAKFTFYGFDSTDWIQDRTNHTVTITNPEPGAGDFNLRGIEYYDLSGKQTDENGTVKELASAAYYDSEGQLTEIDRIDSWWKHIYDDNGNIIASDIIHDYLNVYRPDGTISRIAHNDVPKPGIFMRSYQVYYDEQNNLEHYTCEYGKSFDSGYQAVYTNDFDKTGNPLHSDCFLTYLFEDSFDGSKYITKYKDPSGNVIWIVERDSVTDEFKYYDGTGTECTDEQRPVMDFPYEWTTASGWQAFGAEPDNIDDILTAVLTEGQKEIVPSAAIIASGSCGDHSTWKLDSNYVLYIHGNGDMYNYNDRYHPEYYQYLGDITSIIIDEGVTSIGNYAFMFAMHLNSIKFPDSVLKIGRYSFYGCSLLDNVELPSDLISIGDYAFVRCDSIKSITIPDGTIRIGDECFDGCTSLSSVILPDTVTLIGEDAFCMCAITNIRLPAGLTTISNGMLSACRNLVDVFIPDSVTTIGQSAFCACSALRSLIIPNSVTHIMEYVFQGCESLADIVIPESVCYIGDYAFSMCNGLEGITIPAGVEIIFPHVFEWSYNLREVCFLHTASQNGDYSTAQISQKAIIYCNQNTQIESLFRDAGYFIVLLDGENNTEIPVYNDPKIISGGNFGENVEGLLDENGLLVISGTGPMYDFNNDGSYLPQAAKQKINSIIINSGITTIGIVAFCDLPAIKSVYIDKSVKIIGIAAFQNCTGLQDVYYSGTAIDRANMLIKSENDCLYLADWHYESSASPIETKGSCGENLTWSLRENNDLLKIMGSGSMYDYEDGSAPWSGRNFTRVEIYEGITTIGNQAFAGCTALNTVKIPVGLVSIGEGSFESCANISSITIPVCNDFAKQWFVNNGFGDAIVIGPHAGIIIDNAVEPTETNPGLTEGTHCPACNMVIDEQHEIPALNNMSVLRLPSSLLRIEDEAFYQLDCQAVIIPDGCTSIGEKAFAFNDKLLYVNIPASVITIADDAFERCDNVTIFRSGD